MGGFGSTISQLTGFFSSFFKAIPPLCQYFFLFVFFYSLFRQIVIHYNRKQYIPFIKEVRYEKYGF